MNDPFPPARYYNNQSNHYRQAPPAHQFSGGRFEAWGTNPSLIVDSVDDGGWGLDAEETRRQEARKVRSDSGNTLSAVDTRELQASLSPIPRRQPPMIVPRPISGLNLKRENENVSEVAETWADNMSDMGMGLNMEEPKQKKKSSAAKVEPPSSTKATPPSTPHNLANMSAASRPTKEENPSPPSQPHHTIRTSLSPQGDVRKNIIGETNKDAISRYLQQPNEDPNHITSSQPSKWNVNRRPVPYEAAFEDAPSPNLPPIDDATRAVPAVPLDAVEVTGSDGGWKVDEPVVSIWDKEEVVKQWQKGVASTAEDIISSPIMVSPLVDEEEVDSSFPLRPDSIKLEALPVTAYYSDGHSESSPPLPTPKDIPASPRSSIIEPVIVQATEGTHPEESAHGTEPEVTVERVEPEQRQPPALLAEQRPLELIQRTQAGPHRNNSERRISFPRQGTTFYKRPPSVMHHPMFADQRLFIMFPFSIRYDSVEHTLKDHFARYGTIFRALPYEAMGDSVEKAFVVFLDPESLLKCLADPLRHVCKYRPKDSRLAATEFEIKIKHLRPEIMLRVVSIRLTGLRCDDQVRYTSPERRHEDGSQSVHDENMRLPDGLSIWAVPQRGHGGKIHWAAKIRDESVSVEDMRRRTRVLTGKDPVQLGWVDLRRFVPESKIIPTLCDYFLDAIDIFPPSHPSQSWLITVGGPQEGKWLIDELSRVPGIAARWADENDGVILNQPHSPFALEVPHDLPQVGPMERQDTSAPVTNGYPLSQHSNSPARPDSNGLRLHSGPRVALPLPVPPQIDTHLRPKKTQPVHPVAAEGLPPHNYHPFLRREILPLYKGRVLDEELVAGEIRYIDHAAVFAGRLVKSSETRETLFRTFGKYGKICEIEYNPTVTTSTYATARILFQTRASAARAIQHEHGAISFGCAMKVEARRVLPLDVQMKEVYVDHRGRPISPSMVSQYSPSSSTSNGLDMPLLPVPGHISMLPPPQVPAFGPVPHGMFPAPVFYGFAPPPPFAQPPPPVPADAQSNAGFNAVPPPFTQGFVPALHYYGVNYFAHPNPMMAPPFPPPAVTEATASAPDNSPPAVFSTNTVNLPPSATFPKTTSEIQVPALPVSREGSPKVLGFKEENGQMKVIYEPESLKKYREENNLPEPVVAGLGLGEGVVVEGQGSIVLGEQGDEGDKRDEVDQRDAGDERDKVGRGLERERRDQIERRDGSERMDEFDRDGRDGFIEPGIQVERRDGYQAANGVDQGFRRMSVQANEMGSVRQQQHIVPLPLPFSPASQLGPLPFSPASQRGPLPPPQPYGLFSPPPSNGIAQQPFHPLPHGPVVNPAKTNPYIQKHNYDYHQTLNPDQQHNHNYQNHPIHPHQNYDNHPNQNQYNHNHASQNQGNHNHPNLHHNHNQNQNHSQHQNHNHNYHHNQRGFVDHHQARHDVGVNGGYDGGGARGRMGSIDGSQGRRGSQPNGEGWNGFNRRRGSGM